MVHPLTEDRTQVIAEHLLDRSLQAIVLNVTLLLLEVRFVAARFAPAGGIRCDNTCDMPRLALQFNPRPPAQPRMVDVCVLYVLGLCTVKHRCSPAPLQVSNVLRLNRVERFLHPNRVRSLPQQ